MPGEGKEPTEESGQRRCGGDELVGLKIVEGSEILKSLPELYACWDDEGEKFLDVDDEQEFPTGVQVSCILRDMCGSMFDLMRNIVERQSDIINNELCELMSRVI